MFWKFEFLIFYNFYNFSKFCEIFGILPYNFEGVRGIFRVDNPSKRLLRVIKSSSYPGAALEFQQMIVEQLGF